MFEYLFPIFVFGLAVTGIVCKGLLTAADMSRADREVHARSLAQSTPSANPPESRTATRVVAKSGAVAA